MDPPFGRPAPKTLAKQPSRVSLHGRYVSLVPLEESHSPSLFKHLGGPDNAHLWNFVPEADMPDQTSCDDRIRTWVAGADAFPTFTILTGPASEPSSEAAGFVVYLGATPEHLRIEVGGLVGTKMQRTRAMTEVFYLFIRHAIEELGYHRVQWQASTENTASTSAAKRLGFTLEGKFR